MARAILWHEVKQHFGVSDPDPLDKGPRQIRSLSGPSKAWMKPAKKAKRSAKVKRKKRKRSKRGRQNDRFFVHWSDWSTHSAPGVDVMTGAVLLNTMRIKKPDAEASGGFGSSPCGENLIVATALTPECHKMEVSYSFA